MTPAVTWRGRRGSVLLGPTEDRVARYLADATRHGRVTIRTTVLVDRLGLERSEAYRITARLRVLGLFGVEDDQGGTLGGRRYWRTPTPHDGSGLDATRHRVAWGRILAWARARRSAALERMAGLHTSVERPLIGPTVADAYGPAVPPPAAGPSFRDLFARSPGGTQLLEAWGR